MERPENSPSSAVLFPETRVGITAMEGRIRFGSMMEFSGYDTSLAPERLKLLYEGANPYLVQPITDDPVLEQWYGWRPMTYDSLPIIGPAPRLSNVLLATGHNMLGLSLGASTGKLVAELLAGETPHIDPTPYAVTRFR
jgi:D-amino-acid dehydrogenase